MFRGSEDSAPPCELSFQVVSADIEDSMLTFKLKFDSPTAVSIGESKDVMVVTVADASFFASADSGLAIQEGTTITRVLPKMLPGEEFGAIMDTTKGSVESVGQTLVATQILVTLFIAVSLKSLWNLMTVAQVLAYMRFYTAWPAFMMLILEYADNAITLKPISDYVYDYGKTQYQKANETLSDESLRSVGVVDSDLGKQLGIFSLILLGLLVAVGFYFLIKLLGGLGCCGALKRLL